MKTVTFNKILKQNQKNKTKNLSEEAEKDLLELADISTDKQLEDIKSGKLKRKCKKSEKN